MELRSLAPSCGDEPYRAEILDPANVHDAKRLASLRADRRVQWIDTFAQQLSEWRRLALPDVPEPTRVYAFYPWSSRVVSLLPEDAFVALRTSRNQHKITRGEQQTLQRRTIGIVGLSVGQSIAMTLALERTCGALRLADFDSIELSNLNRIRAGLHLLGVNKAVAAAREIAELDPYLQIDCFVDGYTSRNADAFLDGLDLVIEECDSLDIKVAVREAARVRRIPVIMNTSDRGMTDVERFDLEPARPLFHGRVALPDAARLADLDIAEKVPLVLDILGAGNLSPRLRASLLEIGSSITTWPQLAADVVLGGAVVTSMARRLLLGDAVASGRYFNDIDAAGVTAPSDAVVATALDATCAALSADLHAGECRPTRDVDDDPIETMLRDACSAPSAGNHQPWRWHRDGNRLELALRETSGSSALYHGNRVHLVALGAALETASISASHLPIDATIQVMHGTTPIGAPVRVGGNAGHAPDPLASSIPLRNSDRRRPTQRVPIEASVFTALTAEVGACSPMQVTFLKNRNELNAVADLVAEAERLRMLDAASHRDLLREICWTREEHQRRRDGLCIDALDLSPGEQTAMGLVRSVEVVDLLRRNDLGGGLGTFARQQVATASAVGMLWSPRAGTDVYVQGGRALQRLWLRATAMDVGLCPLATLGFLLQAWRDGVPLPAAMEEAAPRLDAEVRRLFGVSEERTDITLVRMVPQARRPSLPTLRLPMSQVVQRR